MWSDVKFDGEILRILTRNEESSNTGWWQTFLWLNIAVLIKLLFLDKPKVEEEADNGDKTSDQDTEISQTPSLQWPTVNLIEDNGEGFELEESSVLSCASLKEEL